MRRPLYPSSPSVHAVLRHLEQVGFDASPRVLDVDGTHEWLEYLDGASGDEGWESVLSDDGLASAARLLRRYHDAVRSFVAPAGTVWSDGRRVGVTAPDVVLHGDPGPWNMVWRDGEAVGLIDWDHANPGPPLDDLAYLVAYVAPLCSDEEAVAWMRHPAPPDRDHRVEVLADAYGAPVDGLLQRAADVVARTNRTVEHMAARGLEPQVTWRETGRLDRLWARHAWIVAHHTGRRSS